MTAWIPAIAAIVSALAAIFAAVISAVIARGTTHRAVIAEFRQAWINDFRKDIADYLAAIRSYQEVYDDEELRTTDAEGRHEQLRQIRREADPAYYRMRLRINPRPNDSKELDDEFIGSIESLLEASLPGQADPKSLFERLDRALAQGQELLKREWEVTKAQHANTGPAVKALTVVARWFGFNADKSR